MYLRKSRPGFIFIVTLLLVPTFLANAQSCPAVRGLRDVNCDGRFKIAVVGDSIAAGSRGNLRS